MGYIEFVWLWKLNTVVWESCETERQRTHANHHVLRAYVFIIELKNSHVCACELATYLCCAIVSTKKNNFRIMLTRSWVRVPYNMLRKCYDNLIHFRLCSAHHTVYNTNYSVTSVRTSYNLLIAVWNWVWVWICKKVSGGVFFAPRKR